MKSFLKYIFYTHRYFTSLFIRFSIILITEYLYHNYKVLYTDIDYHVFSDGAKHITQGESPYERETYRYTPILAAMMVPNILVWYPIGKFFLCTVDVLVGYLIEELLISQRKSSLQQNQEKPNNANANKPNLKDMINQDNEKDLIEQQDKFGYETLFYLYNP